MSETRQERRKREREDQKAEQHYQPFVWLGQAADITLYRYLSPTGDPDLRDYVLWFEVEANGDSGQADQRASGRVMLPVRETRLSLPQLLPIALAMVLEAIVRESCEITEGFGADQILAVRETIETSLLGRHGEALAGYQS